MGKALRTIPVILKIAQDMQELAFDVVLSGSMFDGGALLIDLIQAMIQKIVPKVRLVRLNMPPVLGAVLIGMEQGKVQISSAIHATLAETIRKVKNGNGVIV